MNLNSKYNQRNYIIIALCLILVVMGVGYAAFSSLLTINGTANISNSWNIEITNIRGVNLSSVENNGAYDKEEPTVGNDKVSATFHTGLISPGDTRIYEVEVTNKGSVDADITSVFNNTLSDSIYFSYDGVGPLGGTGTDVLTNAGVYNTNLLTTEEPFSLPAGTNNVRYIYITVKYRESVASQPTNLEATINLELNATQSSGTVTPDGSGVETVRAAGIDFPVATSGDGLYYDENTAEYYFRGVNPDNYIEFSGDVWRIMSISPGGNLKIIKDERIDLSDYSGVSSFSNINGYFDIKSVSNRTNGYCSVGSASNYGCNAWAAMDNFVNGNYNGPVIADAQLNIFLNTTYKNRLTELSKIQQNMSWNVGAAGTQNDTTSVRELQSMENAYTWIGDIALITKSEFIRSYSNNNCLNAKALRNSECINFLSDVGYIISPFMNETGIVFIAVTNRIGGVEINNNPSTVRPALYLKSNITLTGIGTNDENIYKIVS